MKLKSVFKSVRGECVSLELNWDSCVAIGYAGRNQKAVRAHVDELVKLGVPAPSSVPSMYWIDPERIGTVRNLDVIGNESSGEIEFFCACDKKGEAYVTVASDHTDRRLETVSVSKAKQGCSKVIGSEFWKLSEVRDHWDAIKLVCDIQLVPGGPWQTYQDGTLAMLLEPEVLTAGAKKDAPFPGDKLAFFSGTIAVAGGKLIYAPRWRLSMTDPVLNRTITQEYSVRVLPDRN